MAHPFKGENIMADLARELRSTEPEMPQCGDLFAAPKPSAATSSSTPCVPTFQQKRAIWSLVLVLFATMGSGMLLGLLAFYFALESANHREEGWDAASRQLPNQPLVFDSESVVVSGMGKSRHTEPPAPPAFTYSV